MSEVLGSKNPVECHEAWRGAGKSSGVCEMHRAAGEHDAVPEASNRMEGLKGLKGSEFFSIESLETSIWHWNPQIAWWFETTILSIKIPKSSGWNHHLISTMNRWTEAPDRICTAPRRKGRFLGGSAAYGGALAESQGANLSFDSVHHSKINTYIHRKVYIYIYKDPNNTQRSCAPFTIHISTASLHLFSDFSVFFSLFSCKHQGLCEESLRRLPCPDHLILRCRVVVFSFYHLGGSGEKLHGGWSIQAIWGGSMNEKKPALRVFYGYFMNIWYSRCFMDILWIFVDNCTYFFQNDWPFQNVGSIEDDLLYVVSKSVWGIMIGLDIEISWRSLYLELRSTCWWHDMRTSMPQHQERRGWRTGMKYLSRMHRWEIWSCNRGAYLFNIN